MHQLKTFQVRDEGTHIPVMCLHIVPDPDEKQFIRAGFHKQPYFILTNLLTLETNYDPYKWPMPRTLGEAHRYITKNWYLLTTGDVVDVQYILGETPTEKEPEV